VCSSTDEALRALRALGACVFRHPSACRLPFAEVEPHLERVHRKSVSEHGAVVSLEPFPERSQLRFIPSVSGAVHDYLKKASALEKASADSSANLAGVASLVLAALHEKISTPAGGDELLDIFWYPGQGNGDRPPSPCPAHEDVGLLTVIQDNVNALEVLPADGSWIRVPPLREDEVVLIVGRSLSVLSRGTLPACTHRVAHTMQPRTSFVFEVRPDEKDTWAQAQLEKEAHERRNDTQADERYALAAAALLSTRRGGSQAGCVLM